MNAQQRAVVTAAKKDGLSPMEIAAELMNHDITEVVLGLMRKREVAFNKLSEKDQDAVIAEIGTELKKITATAARVINGQGVECVQAKMKSLKIDGKLTATMVIDGDEPNRHVLTDKTHDKSDILIVLYPNNYSEGMSAHRGERDQKELSLDPEASGKQEAGKKPRAERQAPSAKPIELTEKLLNDAREFVQNQQTVTAAGLQNILRVGQQKVEAVLAKLIEEGFVESKEHEGGGTVEYRLAKAKTEELQDAGNGLGGNDGGDELLTDAIYADVKAHVISTKKVSAGGLSIKFNVSDDVIEQAIQRLELEGVITEENEAGMRSVITE